MRQCDEIDEIECEECGELFADSDTAEEDTAEDADTAESSGIPLFAEDSMASWRVAEPVLCRACQGQASEGDWWCQAERQAERGGFDG